MIQTKQEAIEKLEDIHRSILDCSIWGNFQTRKKAVIIQLESLKHYLKKLDNHEIRNRQKIFRGPTRIRRYATK